MQDSDGPFHMTGSKEPLDTFLRYFYASDLASCVDVIANAFATNGDDAARLVASIEDAIGCATGSVEEFALVAERYVLDGSRRLADRLAFAKANCCKEVVAVALMRLGEEALAAPETAIAYGTTLVELRRVGDSIAFYRRAAAAYPDNGKLLSALASVYWNNAYWDEALALYATISAVDPSDFWAPIMRIHALNRLRRYEEILECVPAMSETYRNHPEVRAHQRTADQRRDGARRSRAIFETASSRGGLRELEDVFARCVAEKRVDDAMNLALLHLEDVTKNYAPPSRAIFDALSKHNLCNQPNLLYDYFLRHRAACFADCDVALADYGFRLFSLFLLEDAAAELSRVGETHAADPAFALTAALSRFSGERSEQFDLAMARKDDTAGRLFALRREHRDGLLGRQPSSASARTSRVAPAETLSLLAELDRSASRRRTGARRRLKIAVCASGQLRGYAAAFPTTLSTLEALGDVDVFVHTWAGIGGGVGANDLMERVVPPELMRCIAPRFLLLGEFRKTFPDAARSMTSRELLVDTRDIEATFRPRSYVVENETAIEAVASAKGLSSNVNQLKMFYKIDACDALRREAEKVAGEAYDLVIRTRCDLEIGGIDELGIGEILKNPDMIGVSYLLPGGVGDQFIVAGSEAMTRIAAVWRFLEPRRDTRYFEGFSGRWNEFLLAEHVFAMGLRLWPRPMARNQKLKSPAFPVDKFLEGFLSDCTTIQTIEAFHVGIAETALGLLSQPIATIEHRAHFGQFENAVGALKNRFSRSQRDM